MRAVSGGAGITVFRSWKFASTLKEINPIKLGLCIYVTAVTAGNEDAALTTDGLLSYGVTFREGHKLFGKLYMALHRPFGDFRTRRVYHIKFAESNSGLHNQII